MSVDLSKVGVVIMSAGRGTRLNCTDKPKVMLTIGGKPIVSYAISTLRSLGFKKEQICLVVGFKKEQIEDYFKDTLSYATQEDQLGTAHAAYIGMKSLPSELEQVLVMGGDDGAFYTTQTLENLIEQHLKNNSIVTLLSAEVKDPASFGRFIMDQQGIKVIEKEYLTDFQKNINEVSTGTYIFNRSWYEKAFPKMPKLRKLGEYGLNVSLVMAQEENKKVAVVKLSNNSEWRGINTLEELELADKLKKQNN
ncbi:MAG: NTP transferase domain-containing protein [Candidatus Magasanikbacteria bacterium]|nr:NTP transferase domain-containing protein [Candidatus Magasanikbacteria bacterium]